MEFKDLVALYFERSNASQTYWNFYITVAVALSGKDRDPGKLRS